MTRKLGQTRDGIYQRNDRGGFWISWTDAQGRRRFRKTDAQNITQARQIRAAELLRVEQAKVLGFSPPGEDNFETVARRYLVHQKVRLSNSSYLREKYQHLSSSFLTEAVGKLDSVFEAVRYQDVTAQNLLTEGEPVSC